MKIYRLFLLLLALTICPLAHATKLAFVLYELSFRGMEVSTFDYAHFNETILGNESIIINFDVATDNEVRTKFVNRFGSNFFDCSSIDELDYILSREGVDILYIQKPGYRDGILSTVCKNAVHAVFPGKLEPHGDAFAFISGWFLDAFPQFNYPAVPYMVRVTETREHLRTALGIPETALVFGRHGGDGSFNVPCAQEAIKKVAKARPDIYFLFLNTKEFCFLPNVIFLPKTTDMLYKAKFINTCDAMIHARWRGETFGLACAEFSIKNKPVITWTGPNERAHIKMLGAKALYYTTQEDLEHILMTFKREPQKNWDAYSHLYTPEKVMEQFDAVFIKPLINSPKHALLSATLQLQFRATRSADGSLSQHTLEHIRDVFACDRMFIEANPSWEQAKDELSRCNRPLLYFDCYWRKSMDEQCKFTPSVLSELHRLDIRTLGHAVIMLDGINYLNKNTIDYLYQKLTQQNFKIFIYNDALIAHQEKNFYVPPFIRAMTVSRLSDIDDYAKTISLRELLTAEKIIGRAYNDYATEFQVFAPNAPYHRLWKGLAHAHAKQPAEAAQCFDYCINAGWKDWRVNWYLAKALYALGDRRAEEEIIKVMQAAANFTEVLELQKTISA